MTNEKEFEAPEKYTLAEMAKHMRDRYEDKDCYEYEILTKAIELFESEPRYTLKEFEENGLIFSLKDLQKCAEYSTRLLKFIKEPHYSIAELEKIIEGYSLIDNSWTPSGALYNLIEFLKDKKKVQEILEC